MVTRIQRHSYQAAADKHGRGVVPHDGGEQAQQANGAADIRCFEAGRATTGPDHLNESIHRQYPHAIAQSATNAPAMTTPAAMASAGSQLDGSPAGFLIRCFVRHVLTARPSCFRTHSAAAIAFQVPSTMTALKETP